MSNKITVQVLCFAAVRELVGAGEVTVALPANAVARDVLEVLCMRHPALRAHAGSIRLAVDGEYVQGDASLRPGAEVALIPPVAGG